MLTRAFSNPLLSFEKLVDSSGVCSVSLARKPRKTKNSSTIKAKTIAIITASVALAALAGLLALSKYPRKFPNKSSIPLNNPEESKNIFNLNYIVTVSFSAVLGYTLGFQLARIRQFFSKNPEHLLPNKDLEPSPQARNLPAAYKEGLPAWIRVPPKDEIQENHSSVKAKDLELSLQARILAAYEKDSTGWIMVPPKELIKDSQPLVVGAGAIGFEGNGEWKIHVSIDPKQMEKAIPIILEVLHSKEAPRLGFKMQTSKSLTLPHQIGKELAIIFDKTEEEASLNKTSTAIQDCLSLLWKKLYEAGIRPEPGYILTHETIEKVEGSNQSAEKENLEIGKFDRAIPCPKECSFFHYRNELIAPMKDVEVGDLEGTPGVYSASSIRRLAIINPEFAHNPSRKPDPFLNLCIHDT